MKMRTRLLNILILIVALPIYVGATSFNDKFYDRYDVDLVVCLNRKINYCQDCIDDMYITGKNREDLYYLTGKICAYQDCIDLITRQDGPS